MQANHEMTKDVKVGLGKTQLQKYAKALGLHLPGASAKILVLNMKNIMPNHRQFRAIYDDIRRNGHVLSPGLEALNHISLINSQNCDQITQCKAGQRQVKAISGCDECVSYLVAFPILTSDADALHDFYKFLDKTVQIEHVNIKLGITEKLIASSFEPLAYQLTSLYEFYNSSQCSDKRDIAKVMTHVQKNTLHSIRHINVEGTVLYNAFDIIYGFIESSNEKRPIYERYFKTASFLREGHYMAAYLLLHPSMVKIMMYFVQIFIDQLRITLQKRPNRSQKLCSDKFQNIYTKMLKTLLKVHTLFCLDTLADVVAKFVTAYVYESWCFQIQHTDLSNQQELVKIIDITNADKPVMQN